MVSFTETAALEWAKSGVRVNAVAPGYVMTDLVRDLIARGALNPSDIEDRTPMARFARPEEIAELLRRAPQPVLLVANKCDGPRWEAHAYEAAGIGFGEPIPVSANAAPVWTGDGTIVGAVVVARGAEVLRGRVRERVHVSRRASGRRRGRR